MPLKPQSRIQFSPQDGPQEIFAKILQSRDSISLNPSPPTKQSLASALGISLSQLSQFKHFIIQAKKSNTSVCIFGDYDVDGLTSTAILWQSLTNLGLDVLPFIPHRQKHGYGLTKTALEEIISGQAFSRPFHPKLIITTDTGIVAHQEIDFLRSQGYQVILTDHHQASATLPSADLVIHTQKTAAAGIAFLLAQELLDQSSAWPLLELATLGIVADQIPLTGINRDLVFHGLKLLQHPSNPGLQALYRQSGLRSNQEINVYTLGFIIAPRLNAMGRLAHGLDALRLLCSSDPVINQRLAKTLEITNRRRQDLTTEAYQQALTQLDDSPLNIITSSSFHEGIIGLVAGKLVELTHKPTLVLSYNSDLVKGSARSVPGFDITQFLRQYQDLFLSVGGHPLAAGFSLLPSNLDTFINKIKTDIKHLSLSNLPSTYYVDGKLELSQLNLELYHLLSQLRPFGLGNPTPKFIIQADIINPRFIGQKNQHFRFQLTNGVATLPAIWFNFPSHLDFSKLSQFVVSLNLNVWNNQTLLQLIIHDGF